jgi:hypothetical protein
MSTLHIVRHQARARARVRRGGFSVRFVLGALLTGGGAALFLSDVARWIAGAP